MWRSKLCASLPLIRVLAGCRAVLFISAPKKGEVSHMKPCSVCLALKLTNLLHEWGHLIFTRNLKTIFYILVFNMSVEYAGYCSLLFFSLWLRVYFFGVVKVQNTKCFWFCKIFTITFFSHIIQSLSFLHVFEMCSNPHGGLFFATGYTVFIELGSDCKVLIHSGSL